HGAQGSGTRVDGLDRPVDGPTPALRGAEERHPGRSIALYRRGSLAFQAARGAGVRIPRPRAGDASKRFPALPVYPYNTQFSQGLPRVWKLLKQVFGSRNQRLVKELGRTVAAVNALEASISALKDEDFSRKTQELKARVAAGTPLDDLVPEAFALVREASRRKMGMRHFDVQLIGGLALHG